VSCGRVPEAEARGIAARGDGAEQTGGKNDRISGKVRDLLRMLARDSGSAITEFAVDAVALSPLPYRSWLPFRAAHP